MASRKLNLRIDGPLDRALNTYMKQNNLTRSQAVRELLRQSLGYADPVDRGWLEGYAAGKGEALEAFHRAADQVRAAL